MYAQSRSIHIMNFISSHLCCCYLFERSPHENQSQDFPSNCFSQMKDSMYWSTANFSCRSKETVDINAQDADGVTIFHLAAMRSELCLFHLLDQGSDPFILTKKRRNALHLACRARQSNIVGYLCHVSLKSNSLPPPIQTFYRRPQKLDYRVSISQILGVIKYALRSRFI